MSFTLRPFYLRGNLPRCPLSKWLVGSQRRSGEVFLPVAGVEPLVLNLSAHSLIPTDYLRRTQPVAREQHIAREGVTSRNKETGFKPVLDKAKTELHCNFENLCAFYLWNRNF
jgi:hypothetical protein